MVAWYGFPVADSHLSPILSVVTGLIVEMFLLLSGPALRVVSR